MKKYILVTILKGKTENKTNNSPKLCRKQILNNVS